MIAENTSIDSLKERTAELFMEVCVTPDDEKLAAEADRALHELDDLLAS